MNEIITSTNNKYYFYLCIGNEKTFTSHEYTSKIECIKDFCDAMRVKKAIWGQLCCHHYADEWQDEKKAVLFVLNNDDVKAEPKPIDRPKFNVETTDLFATWHNEITCKLHDKIEELHKKGAHSLANEKQTIFDQLDEIARMVGVIN